MINVNLILDEYLLSENDRLDLKNIFIESKIKPNIFEGDTHAKGGIIWFPTDLIVLVIGMTAAGFFAALGKDIYKKLKIKLIKILEEEKPFDKKVSQLYFAFDHPKIRLYFVVSESYSDKLDYSIDKIANDYPLLLKEALDIKALNIKSIGSFESIAYYFDEDEDRWIIAHFNKYRE
jgi:hypothetical protein